MSTPESTHNEDGTSIVGKSPRFTYWAAFFVFSIITLGASVEEKNSHEAIDDEALADQRWAIACSSITFGLAFIATVLQLHPIGAVVFVGTKIEGIAILILTAFWAATVSVVSDARNGLAVSSTDGAVINGNLYYFSWAGFVCSIMLLVSYLQNVYKVDVASEIKSRSSRLTIWSALLASELVVLGSSANLFDQHCAPRLDVSAAYCNRTTLGVTIGAIGTSVALGIVGMKIMTSQAPFIAEAGLSAALVLMNAFGVAYITSAKGPGSALGNLYYFSWICLLCSVNLIASCVEEFNGGKSSADNSATAGTEIKEENEIQVDPLDGPVGV